MFNRAAFEDRMRELKAITPQQKAAAAGISRSMLYRLFKLGECSPTSGDTPWKLSIFRAADIAERLDMDLAELFPRIASTLARAA